MMLSFWALVSLPNPALAGGAWIGAFMLLVTGRANVGDRFDGMCSFGVCWTRR